jgi:hypothetical protein
VNLNNFFAELKRRNVYKVAVAYAVVAWLLPQGASIYSEGRASACPTFAGAESINKSDVRKHVPPRDRR